MAWCPRNRGSSAIRSDPFGRCWRTKARAGATRVWIFTAGLLFRSLVLSLHWWRFRLERGRGGGGGRGGRLWPAFLLWFLFLCFWLWAGAGGEGRVSPRV